MFNINRIPSLVLSYISNSKWNHKNLNSLEHLCLLHIGLSTSMFASANDTWVFTTTLTKPSLVPSGINWARTIVPFVFKQYTVGEI